jgi:hypothetical protein
MTDLYLAKVTGKTSVGLVPADQDAAEAIAKMADGEVAVYTLKQPRCLPAFRWWWATCAEIGRNQDPERDRESICAELKVLAGHYVVVPLEGVEGVQVRMPKSISFERLTEAQWRDLLPSLELAGRERFGDEYFDRGAW